VPPVPPDPRIDHHDSATHELVPPPHTLTSPPCYAKMDLLSMLNSDDSKPRSSSVSIAAIINDRPPKTPPPTAPAQPVKTSIDTDDNSSVPRKRQRVDDDEDDEDPSSQSPMLAKTPAREARGSISASSPLEERRESVAMPKVKQEDFGVSEFLEPTIKNVQPVDDLTKFISDFIFLNLNEAEVEHLEVYPLEKRCLF
jgi:hypothetical protein